MFKTRLISGIVLVILALATIICSGPVLLVTLIGVSCIGMQELYRAAGVHEGKTNGLEIAGYLAVVIYYLTIAYLPAGKLSSAGSDPWCAGNDVHFCIYVSKISE